MAVSGQLLASAHSAVRAFWRSGCLGGEDISTTCRWKCLNGSSVRHREFFPKRLISSSFLGFFLFYFLSFLSPLLILEEM
jgi:hypothetical protein